MAQDGESEAGRQKVIEQMKALETKYFAKLQALEKKMFAMRKAFSIRNAHLLEERTAALLSPSHEEEWCTGTPACEGFWYRALCNNAHVGSFIRNWDREVLEHLCDVTYEDEDEATLILRFHFAENEYLENDVICLKVVHEKSLCNGERTASKVMCDAISWKEGMNVTRGRAVLKGKPGKAPTPKRKPRDSFFRRFLCPYAQGARLPPQIKILAGYSGDDIEDALVEQLLDEISEAAQQIKTCIVPYALRWYTGEADGFRHPRQGEEDEAMRCAKDRLADCKHQ